MRIANLLTAEACSAHEPADYDGVYAIPPMKSSPSEPKAHGGHQRVPGQQGPLPGAEVCPAREPVDDHDLYTSKRSGNLGTDPEPLLLG